MNKKLTEWNTEAGRRFGGHSQWGRSTLIDRERENLKNKRASLILNRINTNPTGPAGK